MANNYFEFKKFTVWQENCAMKVSTDGVLLGAWVNSRDAWNILDIGTGTGLIAIMLAQKSKARIDALEIDKNACIQATENAQKCPWAEQINILHSSFQDFSKCTTKKYDLIVSNPPFFSRSLKAKHEKRTLARHNEVLPPEELLAGVNRLLKITGRFSLILPAADALKFITEAALYNLYCNKKTLVRPLQYKNAHRALMEFSHYRNNALENELTIQNETGTYTEEYRLLTGDFYLSF